MWSAACWWYAGMIRASVGWQGGVDAGCAGRGAGREGKRQSRGVGYTHRTRWWRRLAQWRMQSTTWQDARATRRRQQSAPRRPDARHVAHRMEQGARVVGDGVKCASRPMTTVIHPGQPCPRLLFLSPKPFVLPGQRARIWHMHIVAQLGARDGEQQRTGSEERENWRCCGGSPPPTPDSLPRAPLMICIGPCPTPPLVHYSSAGHSAGHRVLTSGDANELLVAERRNVGGEGSGHGGWVSCALGGDGAVRRW